jgi:hypothetical protein
VFAGGSDRVSAIGFLPAVTFSNICFLKTRTRAIVGSPAKRSARPRRAADEREEREKIFGPGGSAQPIEKAHFGQGNQRKSKPFSLIDLAQAWPDFAQFG